MLFVQYFLNKFAFCYLHNVILCDKIDIELNEGGDKMSRKVLRTFTARYYTDQYDTVIKINKVIASLPKAWTVSSIWSKLMLKLYDMDASDREKFLEKL